MAMVHGKKKHGQLSQRELELACHCLVSFLNNRKDSALKKNSTLHHTFFFNGVIYNDDIINLFHPVLLKNAGCPSLLTAPRNAIPKNGNVGKDNDIF